MEDKIRVLISEEDVNKRISEIAAHISKDYEGQPVHLICILKGGVFFTCELAKRLTIPVSLDFMSVSSYGAGKVSSGVVKIIKDLDEPLEDKHVLIVEDIIDSGRTLAYLMEILQQRKPKDIRLCTLLDKPERSKLRWITHVLQFPMNLWWDMAWIMTKGTGIFHILE